MFMGLFLSAFSAVAPPADKTKARHNGRTVAVCFIEAGFQRSRHMPAGVSRTKGMNLAGHCSETASQKHRQAGFLGQKTPRRIGDRPPRARAHRALRASAMR